ncbi:MAG: hypothetical protein H7Z43_01795 [Clostridia bacterium]|nr:hypothetical protein [Deltaproteobacteria bacterium]
MSRIVSGSTSSSAQSPSMAAVPPSPTPSTSAAVTASAPVGVCASLFVSKMAAIALPVAICLTGSLVPLVAVAAEYSADVAIASRDELIALAASGELDEETLETLLQLREAPIDLEHALEESIAQLPGVSRAAARGLSEARLSPEGWTQLRPYVRGKPKAQEIEAAGALQQSGANNTAASGEAGRGGGVATGMLRARLRPSSRWAFGVMALARPRVRIRSTGQPIVSTGERQELGVERFYAAYSGTRLSLVVGSIACAFGDGLTLSTARQLYAARLTVVDTVGTNLARLPLRPVPALRGVGASLALAETVPLRIVATAVVSYRDLDLYQYGEWLRDGASPAIVDRANAPVRYAMVAGAAHETLGAFGAELESRVLNLGVFGYDGRLTLRDPLGTLSPSSRYPVEGRYGALGARARIRVDPLTLRVEVARSRSGGSALVGRVELLPTDWFELSSGVRYYGPVYDNPYTRSFAEPDEVDGARARNERGLDAQLALTPFDRLRLAAWADTWSRVKASSGASSRSGSRRGFRFRANALAQVTEDEALALEGEWTNQEAIACEGDDGPGACGTNTSAVLGGGTSLTATARVSTTRIPRFRLAVSERSIVARGSSSSRSASTDVDTLHRLLVHITARFSGWLTVSLIASQRFTPRTQNLSDTQRVLAASIVWTPTAHVRAETTVRETVRLLASGSRTDVSALAELTLTL